MSNVRKTNVLSEQNEVFSELNYAKALVNVTKTYCQEREFSGQYYGMPQIYTTKISEERNEYISLLNLISDKLNKIDSINLNLEKKISAL